LLAVVIWLVKMFIKAMADHHQAIVEVTRETTAEINRNTTAIASAFRDVHEAHRRQLAIMDDLHDRLLQRPCLLPKDRAG
jgi:uncharacterized protein (DUF305 family)